MAEKRADEDIQQSVAMKRRGILAAAAAVVAGFVAKLAEAPVEETSGDGDQGFLALGSNPWYHGGALSANTPAISSAPTVIQASANFGNFAGANGAESVLFEVDARPSAGNVNGINVYATGLGGIGVFSTGSYVGAWANGTTGVFGSGTNAGVLGNGTTGVMGSGNSIGVSGTATSTGVSGTGATGVLGQAVVANGVGVRGNIPNTTSAASTIAVYGANLSSSDGGAPGAGGFGCYGVSLKGHGLVGATGTAGGGAVVGATNGVSGAWAGIFYGPVAITGLKSAAVAHPDGTHRLLYCVESPESWFEDFGEGQLTDGTAEVPIDPEFAAVAAMSQYHVFLTDHALQHLSVTQRTGTGFTVKADAELATLKGKQACELDGTFSWRVVAKRKDIQGERLAKVLLPPEPKRPNLPAPPDAPPPPQLPARSLPLATSSPVAALQEPVRRTPVRPAPTPRSS